MARTPAELERGRESYSEGAWLNAYEELSTAARSSPLDADDLERLATSAYMLGREDEYLDVLERVHHMYLAAGEPSRAVRCAFWVGLQLLLRGEPARANGWFGRAERVLERDCEDCVERGYLLIPVLLECTLRGDYAAAHEIAAEVEAIGERFGDADLVVFGLQDQGQALIRQGRTSDGLRCLDETMLAVTSGATSPIVTGLVYCNTIAFCQSVYELPRAREWTDALTRWCEGQPEMVAHTGVCLVHRAEIMELSGSWEAALEEARRAHERLALSMPDRLAVGGAIYRQGELHRLRGDLDAAEDAYREAARRGWEPQPGLAFLRLAQGRRDAAAAAIRRAIGEADEPLARLRLLPAAVEVLLAVEQLDEAASVCDELGAICGQHPAGGVPEALASHARGAVELAAGDAQGALGALRRAFRLWSELNVPYEGARTRVLIAHACEALGDAESAGLELDAARATFADLGARSDLARIDALDGGAGLGAAHGLTDRELEVLRLVAGGASNRAIADQLVISEHTVARHLQNIFAKLGVSSRTAAGAFAFEHELV